MAAIVHRHVRVRPPKGLLQLSLPAREANRLEKAAASLEADLRAFAWRRLLLFFLALFPRAAIFTLPFSRNNWIKTVKPRRDGKTGVTVRPNAAARLTHRHQGSPRSIAIFPVPICED